VRTRQSKTALILSFSRREKGPKTCPVCALFTLLLSKCGALALGILNVKVVLINPYELGRQPFGLAEPAAWLKRAGCEVQCLDLSLQMLEPEVLADADLVAIYVAMHTATRIAVAALPRIKQLAPNAHLCVYGLYAPMNEALLRELGVATVLGGEVEPALVSLVQRLRNAGLHKINHLKRHDAGVQSEPVVSLAKIDFMLPDRSGLPALARYAHLITPEGGSKVVGFAEGSRGCKHLCRHCPVVPVYQGKFRILPVGVVMQDIRQQVAAGAQHISFGDPDFFNGPTHAERLVRALHAEFPQLTYDATIKIQHLLAHPELLPLLKETGCLFITSAVESVDDRILEHLAKHHTNADFGRAVQLLRAAGIALAPTFVPFTPWTTLEGYIALLARLVELELIESVPPIQLAIRLLVPQGSELLKLPGFIDYLNAFDPKLLGYPWQHADVRVDGLQKEIQAWVAEAETKGITRHDSFARIWQLAHAAAGLNPPALPEAGVVAPAAHLSEPWYCCAEPTDQQLQSF
jgi:radical SAM superfamily enzyme YgiQ (UPF0313 family)